MKNRKLMTGLCVLAMAFSLTGCFERVETERVEVQNVDPAPVVVPDRDVDVRVETNTNK